MVEIKNRKNNSEKKKNKIRETALSDFNIYKKLSPTSQSIWA